MIKHIVNGVWIVLVGLLGAAVLWLIASPPRGAPVVLRPAPTPPPVLVHITGAVVSPGVYPLSPGSRIRDAVEAAGGLLPDADLNTINLAGHLEDGIRLDIPGLNPTKIPNQNRQVGPVEPTSEMEGNEKTDIKININLASQAELEQLPGIGPAIAEKIILYRDENGFFQGIEDIQNVSGIGPAKYELIKNLITVTN